MIKNLFNILNSYSLFKWLPDKLFLKMAYRLLLDKKLDLENPTTFNEKIQWLKLYNRKAIYTTMVDKYEAKNYVASVIGNEYVIPTLGVWDSFNDIDFNTLPNQFVLKCTHDSGGLVICKDKNNLNLNSAKMKIERCLKRNYYWAGREWPYKNIKPRIIAETYMEDHSTSSLYNYKFFCFNGVAKCYKVDFDRFIEHKANRFTSDGELMKFGEEVCQPDFNKVISVSIGFDKIKKFAEKLSSEQPFLRADFYDREGKIYFGELTFYPASGFGNFNIDGKDELIGSWIQLSKEETGREKMFLIYEDMLCILNRQAIEKRI